MMRIRALIAGPENSILTLGLGIRANSAIPLAVMNERSSPADDDVNLVLCVRRLLLRGHRECERQHQGRHAAKHGMALEHTTANLTIGIS
jgi:hypothetical protein